MIKDLKKRLKLLANKETPSAFSRRCEVPQRSMAGWLDPKTTTLPTVENLVKIANACEVSMDWLTRGEGDMQILPQPLEEDYCQIPLYDVQASAGAGTFVENEQVMDVMALRKNWIQNELHLDPAHLSLIFVQGDSMEPTMHSGDTVLIDQRADQDLTDGVWALRIDGALLVKRVQKFPGGKITIKSDNQHLYPAYDIMSDNLPDDLKFIGRVVWVGKRM